MSVASSSSPKGRSCCGHRHSIESAGPLLTVREDTARSDAARGAAVSEEKTEETVKVRVTILGTERRATSRQIEMSTTKGPSKVWRRGSRVGL